MTLILDKENPLATRVQTRDGRKARLIAVDRDDDVLPIVALVAGHCGGEAVACYPANGIRSGHDDLINAHVTHKRWVNVYPDEELWVAHDARDTADRRAKDSRIACLEIEFKEGDGL